MVKIAIAGGSGHLASEIVDVLVATGKHDILILSRKDAVAAGNRPSVTSVKTDYSDKTQLIKILSGVHTLLSFVGGHVDPGSLIQKTLIDAAIIAGVKRFAPSEWGSATIEELPWYAEKVNIRTYLKEINKEKKVLEYTLFQPGLLIDMLAPAGTSKYLETPEIFIDFPKRRVIIIEGKDGMLTFTTMKDISNVVARAIEYEGEWPVVGGIDGDTVSFSKFLEIAAKARGGKPFDITALKEEDVRAGNIKSSWLPKYVDPHMAPEQLEYFSKMILTGTLLSSICGSWAVSDEWNRLLPDYKFTGAEEFLVKHWAGKA